MLLVGSASSDGFLVLSVVDVGACVRNSILVTTVRTVPVEDGDLNVHNVLLAFMDSVILIPVNYTLLHLLILLSATLHNRDKQGNHG